jgi:hypothetical protein
MKPIGWARVLLCGLVAGGAWNLMSMILVGAVGNEFLASVSEQSGRPVQGDGPLLFALGIAAGVWATWLFAAIRPRHRSTLGAAAVAAFAWWSLASLQSLKWIALLGVPLHAWMPLAANALTCLAAVAMGAFLYERTPPGPRFAAKVSP